MPKLLFFLLLLSLFSSSRAATPPVPAGQFENPTLLKPAENPTPTLNGTGQKTKKGGFFQKVKQKKWLAGQPKSLLQDGEATPKQKRLAKWAIILGLSSIVLLFIPSAVLLAIPAAIVGLILGIKSVEGNSNTTGIIGIIASGLTLVLVLAALIFVATILVTWN